MPGRWSLSSPFSGSEKFMTTLFLNWLDHEDGGIYITNIHDVISHKICIFTSTAARTSHIQSSLAFVMIHRRARPEAVQYRVNVYTLTANMECIQQAVQTDGTYVCIYSLHILCTDCPWLVPSWIAKAQMCAPLLGSKYWIACPSLERNEKGMSMQNTMRKTKAENQHWQRKEKRRHYDVDRFF